MSVLFVNINIRNSLSTLSFVWFQKHVLLSKAQHKKASNHHANLPLEMYSFTL